MKTKHIPGRRGSNALPFLILLATMLACSAADFYKVVKVTFTGAPSDGNKITVDSVDRTFKTSAATPASQVTIGATAADNATALYNQLVSYPLSNITPALNGTIVTLVGKVNVAVTASMTGSWGSVAVTTVSITQYGLNLPLSGEPSSRRVTIANDVVDAIKDYATTVFSIGTPALTNFLSLTATQTVSGPKTFTGPNVHDNASQIWKSGTITNAPIKTVKIGYDNTHPNGIYLYDSLGALTTILAPDANGFLSIYQATVIDYPGLALGTFVPSPGNVLTIGASDTRYARLGAVNAFTGANTFSALQSFNGLFQGTGTNLFLGVQDLYVTNVYAKSDIRQTNTAPTIFMWDSNGAADEKAFKITADGAAWRASFLDDSGGTEVVWLQVSRTGATATEAWFPNEILRVGAFRNDGALYNIGTIHAGVNVGIGSTNITAPAGLGAGLIFTNAAAASGDPVNGAAIWATAGHLQYRTSASGEGAGQVNEVHNKAAEVVGTGTDYAFAGTSYVRVDFSGQDPEMTLPTVGTYLLSALVEVTNGATANDPYSAKFYDSTAAADITNSEQTISFLPASQIGQIRLQSVATVASASHVIQLYAKNATAARGSVNATLTKVSYVRLY